VVTVVVALAGIVAGVGYVLSPRVTAASSATLTAGSTQTYAASVPASLEIPALGLTTGPLVELDATPAGTMEVPAGARTAGWYATNPTPGEPGAAVIAGHVRYGNVRAVFYRLSTLRPGDPVTVRRADGAVLTFTVYRTDIYPNGSVPAAMLSGTTGEPELRLLTCGGQYDLDASDVSTVLVSARLTTGANVSR
jgi:sortase (surface protein transpeptidase)